MTNGEIFTHILHEVTGRPTAESEQLLEALRQEKPGILNWLLDGAQQARSPEGYA